MNNKPIIPSPERWLSLDRKDRENRAELASRIHAKQIKKLNS